MRVIKIELPATLSPVDPEISLASDEIKAQLYRELANLDSQINDIVRERARSYFPEAYSVFVRTLPDPGRVSASTQLWIVDPNVRWPAGLLTRSAWQIFIPIFAHVVREAMTSQMPGVKFHIKEQDAKITVLAPTRSYKDPVILVIATFLLATAFWLFVQPHLGAWIGGPIPIPIPVPR
jgi:hypothetical protein